ncbi:MAG: glutamate--cysteine ligase [Deltaproteobacteria bacterium]|nr:glutamate--cysteine ligase [Deltaproteobacteria bacterium]
MNQQRESYHLFQAYGLELEYMIVDKNSMNVLPISDWLLAELGGAAGSREVERGSVVWSNELAMHVIEVKGNGPVSDITCLHQPIIKDIREINRILLKKNACLMGGAVHPWMNPDTDTGLWNFEDGPIYSALDRVFGCRGHGWFNLQSAHLNLPFCGDDEFARLHAAIRMVLPIIPALAASSPFLDGQDAGVADARLRVYSQHCNRLPEAMGEVIPEPVSGRQQYEDTILNPLYEALLPRDPDGILCHEWSNARGAIARFDRNTIEIRLIDVQEHPGMDEGVVCAVAAAVRLLTEQALDDMEAMNAFDSAGLRRILMETIAYAENALITDSAYLRLLTGNEIACSASRLWRQILARCMAFHGRERNTAEWIIDHGTLASRMRQFANQGMRELANRLCRSLETGQALWPNGIMNGQ